MTQTSNRIFDEMARLMNDAAGVAQGVRREFDTLFRSQAERILRELDVVPREEFEAVKEMARLAREENEALKARIEALEAKRGEEAQAAVEPRRGHRRRWLARYSALSLRFSAPRRYKPARNAAPGTPGGLPRSRAAAKAAFFHWLTRGYDYGDRPGMKATVRPKGGKGAARAARSFRQGAGSDLRRQQAPDDGPARP